jgi:septal ring-binding cell division protein DamX
LSGSSYVIELAHGSDKAQIDALRAALHPAHGTLYDVRLLRDGADWWTLLWGPFDGVDAARAARGELPTGAPINAGWPRPVAPLQNEARRAQD